jgi:hypothetical protein
MRKIDSFLGNSLNQILLADYSGPKRIKVFLNRGLSNFSMDSDIVNNPILALTSFHMIQMFGGRSHEWIVQEMRNWLTKHGSEGTREL